MLRFLRVRDFFISICSIFSSKMLFLRHIPKNFAVLEKKDQRHFLREITHSFNKHCLQNKREYNDPFSRAHPKTIQRKVVKYTGN